MNAFDTLWQKALDLLSYRPLSESEMRQRLSKKFPTQQETVESVIAELRRVELLNDERYTEAYLSELMQKPIGLQKILFLTRQRGLKKDEIEKVLHQMQWSEQESAKRALTIKVKQLPAGNDKKNWIRLANFLKGRGFSSTIIYQIIRDKEIMNQ